MLACELNRSDDDCVIWDPDRENGKVSGKRPGGGFSPILIRPSEDGLRLAEKNENFEINCVYKF